MLDLIISRYYNICKLIEELEKEKETLKKTILQTLPLGIHNVGTYQVTVQERELVMYDPLRVYECIGFDINKFVKLVKVQNTKASDLKVDLSNAIMEKKTVKTVSIREK